MKYDFTSIIDRKGMDATAYDSVGKHKWGMEPEAPEEGFDFIPLWVADMNFATCPAITRNIIERAKHPLFGYFNHSDEYYQSIIDWRKSGGYHKDLSREEIGYENGVHGFLSSAVEVLTEPGDNILLHSPVYVGFKSDVEGLGRHSIYSPLVLDENGVWRMDYEDMDRKIKAYHIKTAIFCSPHNPTGRVWTLEELEKAMAVFEENNVTVLSDEIWADLVFEGHNHIPTQCVNDWAKEHVVAAYAPSKTFNLAGLVGSYHIIYNERLRKAITKHGEHTHYNEMNVLSMHALVGAYSKEGHEWLKELLEVLEDNARFSCDYINKTFDGVSCEMTEGTYMMFLDCSEYCKKTGRSLDEVLKAGWRVGVGWQDGRLFEGPCHIRLNLASPKSRLEEAFRRMKEYVFI
ncbi:MAG: aminotransferase class I/II-fold pyridoxal phosphate-dependent enzyme [Lachnospiraceae bacterium]|nr:aminotransferase class I/II-fold pyridoxal phosphate-dependent enzyme [Lachnospiraceae bacterium]